MLTRKIALPFLAAFLLVLSCTLAWGQARVSSGLDLSLQAGIQTPVGDSGIAASGSYGFTLTASLPVASILDITAGVGYQRFGSHDTPIDSNGEHGTFSKQYTNYPFFAGARLIFDTPVLLPYVGGEVSLNDLVYHATNGISSLSIPAVTSTKLGFAIVAGARLPLGGLVSADATVKYHVIPGDNTGMPTSTFISVNAGIAIHLNI